MAFRNICGLKNYVRTKQNLQKKYTYKMTEVYTLYSENGDEYKLQFTTERSSLIANNILDRLEQAGIEVVEVGLGRVKGENITGHKMLGQIEACIADLLQRHPNVILSYFCDFINLVPRKKKDMTVQEYRSRLFSAMFKRYISLNDLDDIFDNEVRIEGVAETFYFHVIYRKEHEVYANMIAEGHHSDFDKPDE